VVVTGGPPVQYEVLQSINSSQIRSLLITFVLSFIILTALYVYLKRSYLLGTVTLLTLVFVIIWTAGSMHLLGIPLNVVTVTIAAITVGLGIDYSIHVSQRFLEDIAYLEDVDCALCVTMNHTGSALFGSALTTVVGFGLLSLSIIPPLSQFGQVTALSITFAFLASVFVLPTFIRLWYVHGNKGQKARST
jgi:predicted RND superfamily exporter protein